MVVLAGLVLGYRMIVVLFNTENVHRDFVFTFY